MKKLIAYLFISILIFCWVSLAENVQVQNLSSLTSSCTPNETLNMSFYLTNSTNSTTRYPSDTFWNDHDSFIRTDQPGSTIDIWRNGVISSSNCNTWNLVSNVVLASDYDWAQIFKNTDGCTLNIPTYTKTSSTSIDAQIHYSIWYSRIESSWTPRDGKFYYKFDQNTWKCYPDWNSVTNPNNCSPATIKIWQWRRHLWECINYRVYRCGDWLINGYNWSKSYSGGAYTYYEEECDPALTWSIPSGKICNQTTCKLENATPDPYCWDGQLNQSWEQCEQVNWHFLSWCTDCILDTPRCSISVNPNQWNVPKDVTVSITNMPDWATVVYLNMGGWSSNILNPQFPYLYTYYNAWSYQIKLKVRNNYDKYNVDYNGDLNSLVYRCYAYFTGTTPPPTPYCWDGQLNNNEQCDPGSWNFWNGCATGCTLMEPSCTLTVTPNSGVAPLDTNINATKSGWAIFTGLILGDGTPVITNPQFELQHRYNTVWSFTLVLWVKNNYTGSIAAGVTRPTANCTAVVNTTSPGAPIPNIVKKQKTGWMSNFTTDQITVDAWQQITYRVYFGNSGNVAATWEVRDILPPCVDYVSSTISLPAGVDANWPITWTWNNQDTVRYKDFRLGANKGWYMTIVAYIRWTGNYWASNCANITTYINTWYFKFVGSGTLSSQVVAVRPQTPPTPPAAPILTINKEQLTTWNLTAGDYVAYKITVRNMWSWTATGVTIYDLLPVELQYISSSITVPNYSSYLFTTWTIWGGSLQRTYIKYDNITLKKNWTATVYLTWKVKNWFTYNPFTNCATVSGSGLQPIQDCETWNPPTEPHLTIDKELLTTWPLSAWSTVAYKITLTNDWNATYYDAYILDIIPSAIQYQTSRIVNISNYLFSEGATWDNEYFIKYYNFNLNAWRSAIVYMTWILKEWFNFNYTTNCAFTSGGNSCVLLSLGPIPFVQKWQQLWNTTSLHGNWTTGVLTVEPWNFISYRIDFGNSWTSWAYGVVKDILPECVEYFTGKLVGATWIWPNYNSATNTVQFSSVYLATWTTAHMMVVWKIKQWGHCQSVTWYLNTWAFKFNSTDWEYSTVLAIRTGNPGNDINVTIQKTVDKQYVVPWDIVTYTINYTNHWPDTLTSYTIRDIWPSDKLYYSGVVSMNPVASSEYEWMRDWNIVTWTFNTPLPADGTGQIVIQWKVR